MTDFALSLYRVGENIDYFLKHNYNHAPKDPFAKMGESFLYTGLAVTALTGCLVSGAIVGAYAAVASLVYTVVTPIFVEFSNHPRHMSAFNHYVRLLVSNVVASAFFANSANFGLYIALAVISDLYQTLVNGFKPVPFEKAPLFVGPVHIHLF